MEVSGLVWRRELRKVQFVNVHVWMLHSFMSICYLEFRNVLLKLSFD